MKKLRKVTHLRVFDFLDSFYAYGLRDKKNDFGYTVRTDYYYGDKKIFSSGLRNNVRDKEFYYCSFGINVSQLSSLKRKVNKLMRNGFLVDDSGDKINVDFLDGSDLVYKGYNKRKFMRKVLDRRLNK